jgi:hypothetical protein
MDQAVDRVYGEDQASHVASLEPIWKWLDPVLEGQNAACDGVEGLNVTRRQKDQLEQTPGSREHKRSSSGCQLEDTARRDRSG